VEDGDRWKTGAERMTEKTPRTCEDCEVWKAVKQRIKVGMLLDSVIKGVELRIAEKEFKPTMAEYLKLLQMEQEAEQEMPKEIKVTWVEPETTTISEE
jgi:hypothetical protein